MGSGMQGDDMDVKKKQPKTWEMIMWYFAWVCVFSGICFAIYALVRVLTKAG